VWASISHPFRAPRAGQQDGLERVIVDFIHGHVLASANGPTAGAAEAFNAELDAQPASAVLHSVVRSGP